MLWPKKTMFLFCNITHSLFTPRSTVLLEKLTGPKLVKKVSSFPGTRRFITAFTSARHPFLSWASSIQSINVAQITLSRSVSLPLRKIKLYSPKFYNTEHVQFNIICFELDPVETKISNYLICPVYLAYIWSDAHARPPPKSKILCLVPYNMRS